MAMTVFFLLGVESILRAKLRDPQPPLAVHNVRPRAHDFASGQCMTNNTNAPRAR
jgi:hypothetical protein